MDKTLCKPDTYERPESEVLELITAERARVKKPNGMYPLHYAAHYSKSKAVVDALIAEFPEALQAKNNFGETPGVTAQSHSKSAEVKAVFAAAERDGGAGSKARKEKRNSVGERGSLGSMGDRGSLGERGSVGDQAIALAISSARGANPNPLDKLVQLGPAKTAPAAKTGAAAFFPGW